MNRKTIGYIIMSTLFASAFSAFGASKPENGDTSKAESKQARAPKLAFVNVQRIITVDESTLSGASAEWRDLYQKIQKSLEPIDKELASMQEEGKKAGNEFDTLQKSALASKEALQRKYEEVARLEMKFRQRISDRDKFVQEELARAQGQVGPKLDKVINEIRVDQGWDMILRGEVVLAVGKGFDITDDVLARLNKDYSVEKAKKADTSKKKSE